MIKAVIFDCFGVLVASSYEPFKKKYFKGDQKLIDQFLEIENKSSRGEISLLQAEEGFARMTGLSIKQVIRELSINPRNQELLEYISNDLKPFYKIGFLSNAAADRTKELFTEADMSLFDDVILSYKFGIAKPETDIYHLAAERLGIAPNECIFIDDNQSYIAGALKAGMQAVQYTDFMSLKHALHKLLN